ncbi:MAG: site-2 protease family protein [Ignavibacteriaceae bacterium]|nr:site-2 protease family protein [Ignavibacteriaceae bacterium]
MPEDSSESYYQQTYEVAKRPKQNYVLHLSLFLVTFVTTTIAGADWISGFGGPYEVDYLVIGLPYSLSILFILATHEFGHFFAAKIHKVDSTLPYFIPFPSLPGFLNFGTLGAVIKTRSRINSNRAMFDIGVAGPIAGFIASLIVLIYGFMNVPGEEYILRIHPDYFSPDYGKGALALTFGDNILFLSLKALFVSGQQFFPPMSEIYHYPYLCVGWFGLFVTAMNLIPVGQLDGGHLSYTMFGAKNHFKISVIGFSILFILGTLGIVESFMDVNTYFGWSGWLFWALVLYFIIKLKHPPVYDNIPIDFKRKVIGYFTYIILIISFTPTPFIIYLK